MKKIKYVILTLLLICCTCKIECYEELPVKVQQVIQLQGKIDEANQKFLKIILMYLSEYEKADGGKIGIASETKQLLINEYEGLMQRLETALSNRPRFEIPE